MANDITNRLRFDKCSKERCQEILEAIQIEDIGFGSIDFGKIIPEPNFTSDQECIKWRIKNWDTKWEAYGYRDGIKYDEDKNEICFLTANRSARKLILALSRQYPDVLFELRYADDNFGFNVGEISIMAGEDFYGNIPKDNTFEAQEMAADIMGFKLEFDIESASGYVRMIDKNLFQYCEGVHVSQSFQCDASLGHPVVLCYDFDNSKSILRNEKYKGDVLTQKTYCADLLTHKRVKNNGEVIQHYLQDHHPAIVERDLFDKVQAEYAKRNAKKVVLPGVDEAPKRSRYSSKYALTDILVCGHCGSPYRRCVWTHHGKRKVVWRCITRMDHGLNKCDGSFTIEEEGLHQAILDAISDLSSRKEELKDELKSALATTLLDTGADMCLTSLEQQIKEQENDLMRVVRITAERGNKSEFETEFKRISANIKDLKQLLEVEKTKVRPKLDIESRLEALFEKIDSASANIQEFNNQVIRQLIAQIRIDGEDKMTIILTNGYRFEAKR